MFRCDVCGVTSLPKVSPVLVPVQFREKSYLGWVEDEELGGREYKIVGNGKEIVKEHKLCPSCSGIPAPVEVPIDARPSVGAAKIRFAHARKCKGVTKRKVDGETVEEPCKLCKAAMEWFGHLPSPILSVSLEDSIPQPASFRLSTLALDSMIERTNHKGKRAARDFAAAAELLAPLYRKEMENRG